ncbi:MAG: GDSL-type esterase/lipase family protein [Myxococcota bacterium]
MQVGSRGGRSLRFKLVAASVVLVLTLGGLEAFARVVGPSIPAYTDGPSGPDVVLLNGHPSRLWYTAPGVKSTPNDGTAHINRLGLRGDLPADPKPAGVPRVLVVGDSSLFGHGVEDDETFPAQLGSSLAGLGHPAEVVNGGTPGYSTEQTRLFLDEMGWDLRPDLLVIGNLWSDNNFDSFQDADLLRTQKAFANPLASSALYRMVASWADVLRGGRGARIVSWTAGDQLPTEVGRRVPLARYAENLDAMVREARARDIGVAFLALTNIDRIKDGTKDWSWEPYFAVQREVAAWHGLPIFDAQLVFVGASRDDPTDLFVDSMHPSALGHRLLGQFAARRLVAAGWPDKQRHLGKAEAFPGTQVIDNGAPNGPRPPSAQDALFKDTSPPMPGLPPPTR